MKTFAKICTIWVLSFCAYGAGGYVEYDSGVADTPSTIYFDSTNNRLGIGTTSPDGPLHLSSPAPGVVFKDSTDPSGDWYFFGTKNAFAVKDRFGNKYTLWISQATGNVGLGTTSPDYKLDVKGTIRSEEIIVSTGWSDYVFNADYNLMPLGQVKAYIEDKGHLPGMPSASEVQENGVGLAYANTKLLEKIEELTLYLIDLKEENLKLAERLEKVEAK